MVAPVRSTSRWPACFLLLVHLAGAGAASALESGNMVLTAPVRLELRRLQESWQDWSRAYFQDDEDQARMALTQMLSIAERLGMKKLPDQSIACAAYAVRSAREGNYERARWAVAGARQLDSGRPEAEFASSTLERLDGHYVRAVSDSFSGYGKLFELPLEGRIWRQNLGVGGVYLLMLASGLFVALLMSFRGAALFHDLGRLFSPPLPSAVADAAAAALLIWPLVLPSGLLWLALYWSVLLWSYATLSQRTVLIFLWVLAGLSPMAVAYHQKEVHQTLQPARRAIENLKAERLYGALFLDLEVLSNVLGESPAVTELVADVHRQLGQWEHARLIYNSLVEDDPDSPDVAPALNNIGVYHHRRGDYGTAVNYFTDAAKADPNLAEAYFNLSQAYNQNFAFTEAHQALAEAKRLDPVRVEGWEDSEGGTQGNVIPINGGLRQADRVLQALDSAGGEGAAESLFPRAHLSIVVALAASILAAGFDLLRRQKGWPSVKFARRPSFAGNRWLHALVPGWYSTQKGRGARAFLALVFPLALVLVPMLQVWGYRAFLGYDAGPGLATIFCLVLLVAFFGLRVLRAPQTVG